MDSVISFITVLAWAFGILSSGLVAIRLICAFEYTDIDRRLDRMQGIQKTFPILWPGIISIVCWAWIIVV